MPRRSHEGGTGPLPDPAAHAARFSRQRAADRGALAQDYVELIADLLDGDGEARAVDVARRLGVTPATVTNTVGRLVRAGLVEARPYRSLFLTAAGRAVADRARARHATVQRLLVALGVEPMVAAADAEGIEHHVSDATLEAFERFLKADRP